MSIRLKFTITFIAVIIASNLTLALMTYLYINKVYLEEVQTRVRLDLNSARIVYNNHIENLSKTLRAASLRRLFKSSLEKELSGGLGMVLQQLHRESGIDMLILTDQNGKVVFRAHNPSYKGDDISNIPVVKETLKNKKEASGTFILRKEDLQKENPTLASRAIFKLKNTPGARPDNREYSSDGMIIAAAVPFVESPTGKNKGILYAANLLNGRTEIVDTIKNEVFQNLTYNGKDIGTATIFLEDIRISTNVKNDDGSRALGSRLSAQVYDHVILQDKTWADEAFVVNDRYITAYEPIHEPGGKIIGALYVGLLKKPFTKPPKVIMGFFILIVTLTSIASLAVMSFITRKILAPIKTVISLSRRIIGGDLTARIETSPAGEMGLLCSAINTMAETIAEREHKIEETAKQQISESAKLASIGRLAAGIAHEVNNPMTGVLTFAHLLREKETIAEEDKQDLDIIIKETTRVREIVRGLLDFARQSPSAKKPLDINETVRQTIRLIKSQKEFKSINIIENFDNDIPAITADKNQLQQALLNLALNSCEAMTDKGTLTIKTYTEDASVKVSIKDTGCGIKQEFIDKIFEPFFTTKPVGKGTGLGLSISYGNIRNHGGTIEVSSQEGQGSVFTIILPINHEDNHD